MQKAKLLQNFFKRTEAFHSPRKIGVLFINPNDTSSKLGVSNSSPTLTGYKCDKMGVSAKFFSVRNENE